MKKVLAVFMLVVGSTSAFACGPLPFCSEPKYLRQECSKPFELDSGLDIENFQIMAKACQSVGMTMKVKVKCFAQPDYVPACKEAKDSK